MNMGIVTKITEDALALFYFGGGNASGFRDCNLPQLVNDGVISKKIWLVFVPDIAFVTCILYVSVFNFFFLYLALVGTSLVFKTCI